MAFKIAFIGGGSFGFTRTVVRDVLTYPLLQDAEIALMDIHEGRLEMARQCCQKIIDAGGYAAKITTTTNRREALKGADGIIVTILTGDTSVWKHDILIPKKYGVDINVGDTRGPSGIFRALRTIPEMLSICKDIRELCPLAIMLNYTNPMAMLCQAMQKVFPDLNISGLCHSVQGTANMLAEWCGQKLEDVDYVCAGINHMAWYTKFEHKGKDLYPKLKKLVSADKKIHRQEQVRNEMFLALDYYVTESSGHNSEYNWWFRKRPDLIKKYCSDTKDARWNPGIHAYILTSYAERAKAWRKELKKWLDDPEWKDQEKVTKRLERSHEYASAIINAWVGGELFKFNGNVPNTGLITNLPQNCCVEVPVLASRRRLEPIHIGDLPKSVVSLTSLSANNEMLAVEGSLEGDARKVYQAIANDPLTASVLSLEETKKMVDEMFHKNKKYLPQFKKISL